MSEDHHLQLGFIQSVFANETFKTNLRQFYREMLSIDSIRQQISLIARQAIEIKNQSQHSDTTNSQKFQKSEHENLCASSPNCNKQSDGQEEEILIEIEQVNKEINQELQKFIEITCNRELFEIQQSISSKINMELQDFKQEQRRILQAIRKQIDQLHEKGVLNLKFSLQKMQNTEELLNINSNQKINQNQLHQQEEKKKIIDNRRLITSQLLQCSRIENKNSHEIMEDIQIGLSYKNIPESSLNECLCNKSEERYNKKKNKKSNIYILNDENFDEGESFSSQLQLESKINEVTEQSQKWLKQANKWYLHVLSKVQKLQVSTFDIKSQLLDKFQSSLGGVWNVLTDIQQKVNELSNKKKK